MPRQPPTAEDSALRLLAARDRSTHDLRALLKRRGFPPAAIEAALTRLTDLHLLNDARFAERRASSLLAPAKHGLSSVRSRLLAHGIPPQEVDVALATASAEASYDPLSSARALLQKRGLADRDLTPKEAARALRLLHSRGFPEAIAEELVPVPPHDGLSTGGEGD